MNKPLPGYSVMLVRPATLQNNLTRLSLIYVNHVLLICRFRKNPSVLHFTAASSIQLRNIKSRDTSVKGQKQNLGDDETQDSSTFPSVIKLCID